MSNRPDKDSSPQAWEQSWVRDLTEIFPEDGPVDDYKYALILTSTLPETMAASVESMSQNACVYQKDLALDVSAAWVRDDFENTWRKATDAERKDAILAGLVSTCKVTHRTEQTRFHCPDMTVKDLAANRGELFLHLIRQIMPDVLPTSSSSYRLTVPKYVPLERMEERFRAWEFEDPGSSSIRVRIRYIRACRTQFMTMALKDIFAIFVSHRPSSSKPFVIPMIVIQRGLTPTYRMASEPVQKLPSMDRLAADKMKQLVQNVMQTLAHQDNAHTPFTKQKVKRKGYERACSRCGLWEENLKPGQALRCSSACRKVGRPVWYCSEYVVASFHSVRTSGSLIGR